MKKRILALLTVLILMLPSIGAFAEPAAAGCPSEDAAGRNNGRHFWTPEGSTAASCTSAGTVTWQCVYCGQSVIETVSAPLEHTFVQVDRSDATCISPGYVTWQCTTCGTQQTEILSPTGNHNFSDWVMDEKATCKERELQRRTCKSCGKTEWRYIGDLLPHTWGDWVTVTPATAWAPGVAERTCKVCGTKEQQETSASPAPVSQPADTPAATAAQPSLSLEGYGAEGTYTLDDVISIDYRLTNTGNVTLALIQSEGTEGIALPQLLPAGMSFEWNLKHKVTQADLDKALVSGAGTSLLILPVIVQYGYTEGGVLLTADGESFNAFQLTGAHFLRTGEKPPVSGGEEKPDVFIIITVADDAGYGAAAGDTIELTVTRFNNYTGSISEREISVTADVPYAAGEVKVLDDFTPWRNFIYDIPAGKNESYTHTVTVQPEDIANGYISRTISIMYAYDPSGKDYSPFGDSSAQEWTEEAEILIPLTADKAPVTGGETQPEGDPDKTEPEGDPNPKTPEGDPDKATKTAPDANAVTVVKSVKSESDDLTGYAPEEIIHFEIAVTNHTGSTLANVMVYDALETDPIAVINILDGETVTCGYLYTVTDEDAENENVSNTASVVWRDPETGTDVTSTSNEVNVKIIPRQPLSLTVVKSIESAPQYNEAGFVEGEDILFRITVTNNSKQKVESVSIQDALAKDLLGSSTIREIPVLLPGASESAEWTYTVTNEDVTGMGFVTNVAYILYNDPVEDTVQAQYSNVVVAMTAEGTPEPVPDPEPVPAPDPDPLPPPEPAPDPESDGEASIAVTKSVKMIPIKADGSPIGAGEELEFEIIVTNTGKTDLTNVEVYDTLEEENGGLIAVIPSLPVGAGETLSYKWKIDTASAGVGLVKNQAIAMAFTNDGTIVYAESDMIYVPLMNIQTRVPEPTPKPENSCRVILTSFRDGAWEYTLRLCDEHRATALRAGMRTETSMRRMDADAWIKAEAIWRDAVGKEYDRLGETQDRYAFFSLIDSEEALLLQMYPEDRARVAKEITGQLVYRCVELCDIRSHPSAERMDRMENGYAADIVGPMVTDMTVDDEGRFIFTFADEYAAAGEVGENGSADTWRLIRDAYLQEARTTLAAVSGTREDLEEDFEDVERFMSEMLSAHEAFLNARFPGRDTEVQQMIAQSAMRMLVHILDLAQ